jgi:hypothetical protein
LLNTVYDDVSRVVGETFDEDKIVAALRACNYNPENAIGYLLDPPLLPKKQEKPKPKSLPILPSRPSIPEPKLSSTASKKEFGKVQVFQNY